MFECASGNYVMISGVLKKKTKTEDDSDEETEHEQLNRKMRVGGGKGGTRQLDSDDETSDFSD